MLRFPNNWRKWGGAESDGNARTRRRGSLLRKCRRWPTASSHCRSRLRFAELATGRRRSRRALPRHHRRQSRRGANNSADRGDNHSCDGRRLRRADRASWIALRPCAGTFDGRLRRPGLRDSLSRQGERAGTCCDVIGEFQAQQRHVFRLGIGTRRCRGQEGVVPQSVLLDIFDAFLQ